MMIHRPIILCALLIVLTACLQQNTRYRASFLLSAPKLSIENITFPYALKVLPVKVAAPYSDKLFIYRFDENRYESDFYNYFLASPNAIFTEAFITSLRQSQLFKQVVPPSYEQPTDLILQIVVTQLYADYRNKPLAVLSFQAYLSETLSSDKKILLDQTIQVTVPLPSKHPESYVQAINTALANSIGQLKEKIRTALFVISIR